MNHPTNEPRVTSSETTYSLVSRGWQNRQGVYRPGRTNNFRIPRPEVISPRAFSSFALHDQFEMFHETIVGLPDRDCDSKALASAALLRHGPAARLHNRTQERASWESN